MKHPESPTLLPVVVLPVVKSSVEVKDAEEEVGTRTPLSLEVIAVAADSIPENVLAVVLCSLSSSGCCFPPVLNIIMRKRPSL